MLYTETDFSVHRDGRKKDKQMATELARIAELSAQNPTMVFTSIAHLINVKLLRECHEKMDGDKAVGIDGVTKEEYGKNLEENLVDLVARMKKRAYKPKPARRVEIPKDNGKTSRSASTATRTSWCRKHSGEYWKPSTSRCFMTK